MPHNHMKVSRTAMGRIIDNAAFATPMQPSPTLRVRGQLRSAYTVYGFVGYGLATVLAIVLSRLWDLTLAARLVTVIAPALAFIMVAAIATAVVGTERLVFYQISVAAVVVVAALGFAVGARSASLLRMVDITVMGIGTFLVFGRIGCHSVGCCHGRPARSRWHHRRWPKMWLVSYDDRHIAVGFWPRYAHRGLWPLQLLESALSATLVVASLAASSNPGCAALTYVVCYGVLRFALEFARGDAARPGWQGLSEAQWMALFTVLTAAICSRHVVVAAAWIVMLAAAGVGIRWQAARAMTSPRHLRELDELAASMHRIHVTQGPIVLGPPGAPKLTSQGLALSAHVLPAPHHAIDWIISAPYPLSNDHVARIKDELWPTATIVAGQRPELVHIVEPIG